MSDWKDACPGLLSNIHRILTVRFAFVCQQSDDFRPVLQQTFACTCFLYYNLCLCKSFKERALQESASKVNHLTKRRLHLICGCKGTLFLRTDKTFRDFFQKKMHFPVLYIIYYIRAREKSKENGRHSTWSDCRFMLSQKDIYPSYFTKTWLCRGLSRSAYLKPFGLALLSLNQDLDFVEVFHVRNTSNELGFALT